MSFDPQPRLKNQHVRLEPLTTADFAALYAVAADPQLWVQHPNPNRWQRSVFEVFFRGAIESGSAVCVFDSATDELLGSSRYYDLNEAQLSIAIGYTFIARHAWGRQINASLKSLMLNHAFENFDRVYFHIGVDNIRSRKSIEKIGAMYVGDEPLAYYGEPTRNNAVYVIDKTTWNKTSKA
jgi:RimJ/RimL family protein N-acetyltransferase